MLLVDDHDADGQIVGDGTDAAVFCSRHAEVRVTVRRMVVLTYLVLDPHRSLYCQDRLRYLRHPEWYVERERTAPGRAATHRPFRHRCTAGDSPAGATVPPQRLWREDVVWLRAGGLV